MPILPDDIGWLRRWLKLEALTKQLFVSLDFQGLIPGVFFFKGDESGRGSCQFFEVLEQVIDDSLLFLDTIKPLESYVVTTISKRSDQFVVVKGEDQVCNVHIRVLSSSFISDFFPKHTLDLFNNVPFKTQCW